MRNCLAKEHEKSYTLFLIIIFFIFSVLFRMICADYYKYISIYPDELRYYSISRSLLMHQSIEVYNLKNSFQKILYSIVIMPAFLFDDGIIRIKIITLINSILVSSGVFPVYFMSKRFLSKKSHILFCCILYICSSDLCYSCTFMSENLFLPMSLWAVLLMVKGIQYADGCVYNNYDNKKRRRYHFFSFITGVYLFLLYLCKEIAIVFLISYISYCFIIVIRQSYVVKKKLCSEGAAINPIIGSGLMIIGFVVPFLLLKLTLFNGLGNSYDQQDMSVFSDSFNFYYLYYGFVYFLLMTVLAYTVFPFIISIINRKKMDVSARHTFYFLCLLLVLSAAVISFTITARENNGETLPRVHLRYTCYLFMPFIIIMFNSLEHMEKLDAKKLVLTCLGMTAWFFYYFIFENHQVVQSGVLVDQTQLMFLSNNDNTGYQLSAMLIYTLITFVTCFLLIKKQKKGVIILSVFLLILAITNSVLTTCKWRETNKLTSEEKDEALFLQNLVNNNRDKSFLFVGSYRNSNYLMDTYFLSENVYSIRIDSLEDYISNNNEDEVTWSQASLSLLNLGFNYTYDDLSNADYIICDKISEITIADEDCSLVSGPMEYPKIYKINDPEHIPDITVNNVTITQNQLDAE